MKSILNVTISLAAIAYIFVTIFPVMEQLPLYTNEQLGVIGLKYAIVIAIGLNSSKVTTVAYKIAGWFRNPKKGIPH